MGRLLKKKTAVQKIKKKQKSEKTDDGIVASDGSAISSAVKAKASPDSGKSSVESKPIVKVSEDSVLGKSIQFLKEVKVELKKVAWPTRKQTTASTIVVIVLVIIVSLFLGLVDMGLSGLVRIVLG